MKILAIVAFMFLLVGCTSSARYGASLTPDQAKAIAIRFANDEASALPLHAIPNWAGRAL